MAGNLKHQSCQHQGLEGPRHQNVPIMQLRYNWWGAPKAMLPSLVTGTQEKSSLSTGPTPWLVAAGDCIGTGISFVALEQSS